MDKASNVLLFSREKRKKEYDYIINSLRRDVNLYFDELLREGMHHIDVFYSQFDSRIGATYAECKNIAD